MSWFKRIFKRPKPPMLSPEMTENYRQVGIKIELDTRFYMRIEDQNAIYGKLHEPLKTDPKEFIEQMQDRVDFVMSTLRTTGIPFGVAGHKESSNDMLTFVRIINKRYLDVIEYINHTRNRFNMKDLTKQFVDELNLITKLYNYINYQFMFRALEMMDMSWLVRDVSIHQPIVITPMPMQQPYGGGPTPYQSNLFGQPQPRQGENQ